VSLQLAVRFIHLLAVVTWVGGMLFIALVLVPITRRLDDAALRTRLVQDAGRRFRAVGWIALGLIVTTGLGNLALRPELLWAPRLHAKLGLVVLALILGALHDFGLGPRAGRPGADPSARARASWMARVNVLVALGILALGLALRG
jgi:putative copper export protein